MANEGIVQLRGVFDRDTGALIGVGTTSDTYPLLTPTEVAATRIAEVPFGYFISGRYYGCTGTISSSAISGVGSLRVSPFYVRTPTQFSAIGAEVTSAGSAGALIRLGIYGDAGNGYPSALVVDAGTIDGTVVAAAELSINVTLARGLYWLAAAVQGAPATQPTIRTVVSSSQSVGATTLASATGGNQVGYIATGVTAAFPATFPTLQVSSGLSPRVVLKVT